MSSLVTPAGLDAIVPAATAGTVDQTAAAIRYDFRRPDRIAKERMAGLRLLHDRSAFAMSTSMSAYLRTNVSIAVTAIDQCTYAEFLATLADPTAYYAVAIAPYTELGAIEVSPSIAFVMIDRMLGGSGQTMAENRPLTQIEQNVVDSVVKLLLEGLGEAWTAATSLTFSIRGRETRPRMLSVTSPAEAVVAIAFDVRMGESQGTLNLCIPASIVEEAGGHFAQSWPQNRRQFPPAEQTWLAEHLRRVPVDVVPQIRTRLKASAVLSLQPGEVLALPLAADQPLDVYVAGERKLAGRLAADQGRLMVMVAGRQTADAGPERN
jgi:flagellar motor switch protein FliM